MNFRNSIREIEKLTNPTIHLEKSMKRRSQQEVSVTFQNLWTKKRYKILPRGRRKRGRLSVLNK
jgi:hypothetical protein